MKYLLATLAVLAAVLFAAPAQAAPTMRPCLNDEVVPHTSCVWDGHHLGNHRGRSFVLFDGRLTYVSHTVAHQLLTGGVR